MNKLDTLDTLLNREVWKLTDFSKDGKCSNCGGCCNDILPLTNADINRIKNYVKKNNIQPSVHFTNSNVMTKIIVDVVCPFRDETKKICTIYPVRPVVCKGFTCYESKETVMKKLVCLHNKANKQSMRETFFN